MFPIFKFPSTNFNEINLTWIMKTIKALEPAADMVQESQAALEAAQATAAAAQATATAAQAAVDTVTAQAEEALDTAAEALETAQQAASGVIGDGSVTRIKLSTEVRGELDGLRDDLDETTTTANNAFSGAAVAQQMANQALNTALAANSSAQAAATTAANAETTANNASSTASSASSTAATALTNANSALAAVAGKLGVKREANTTANTQKSYTLTGSPINMYMIVLASNTGTNHNTIFWVNTASGVVRLLGNIASGVSAISVTNGVLKITTTVACFVWSMPLPDF